jgi:hypothetical protein
MKEFFRRYPHVLEKAYQLTEQAAWALNPWIAKAGYSRVERLLKGPEDAAKGLIFGCQRCGQCVLHSTGMTCPMNCPKNLRNGPCGGVRPNGHCEVKPEMRCVWVVAFETSQSMPIYGHELHAVQPPVDRRLQDTSAWVNMLTGVDKQLPEGWIPVEEVA